MVLGMAASLLAVENSEEAGKGKRLTEFRGQASGHSCGGRPKIRVGAGRRSFQAPKKHAKSGSSRKVRIRGEIFAGRSQRDAEAPGGCVPHASDRGHHRSGNTHRIGAPQGHGHSRSGSTGDAGHQLLDAFLRTSLAGRVRPEPPRQATPKEKTRKTTTTNDSEGFHWGCTNRLDALSTERRSEVSARIFHSSTKRLRTLRLGHEVKTSGH